MTLQDSAKFGLKTTYTSAEWARKHDANTNTTRHSVAGRLTG